MVGGLRGQTFGAVCTVALVYQSVRFGAISMKQIDFSTTAVLPEPLRSPPPLFKVPTLHGDHTARKAHSNEELDALATRNRTQAFLSTPTPRTPSPHGFKAKGDKAKPTSKPPRTIGGDLTSDLLSNTSFTDDATAYTHTSSGSGCTPRSSSNSASFLPIQLAPTAPNRTGGNETAREPLDIAFPTSLHAESLTTIAGHDSSPTAGQNVAPTHTDLDQIDAALAAKMSHLLMRSQNRFTNPGNDFWQYFPAPPTSSSLLLHAFLHVAAGGNKQPTPSAISLVFHALLRAEPVLAAPKNRGKPPGSRASRTAASHPETPADDAPPADADAPASEEDSTLPEGGDDSVTELQDHGPELQDHELLDFDEPATEAANHPAQIQLPASQSDDGNTPDAEPHPSNSAGPAAAPAGPSSAAPMEVDTPPGNTPPTAGPIDVVFSPALPFGGLAHDPPPVPANLIPNNLLSLTIPSSWSGRDLLAAIRHHYVEFTSIRNIRRLGLVRCGDSDRSSMEDVTLSVIIGSLLVTDNTPNIAEHIPTPHRFWAKFISTQALA